MKLTNLLISMQRIGLRDSKTNVMSKTNTISRLRYTQSGLYLVVARLSRRGPYGVIKDWAYNEMLSMTFMKASASSLFFKVNCKLIATSTEMGVYVVKSASVFFCFLFFFVGGGVDKARLKPVSYATGTS